ncbi:hypothetical protein BASA50_006429 [Batrachochytrium salamandrivorans]|uniref:Vitamin B6 photo-protection and homoeostasis-domain-containing protein n=1 Tax=Batrachochytrium salamandrivorans TaxID=1357716 RepID=A0ABQ8FA49_9FUNG|nr:hypothetical protein BASA60_010144 [Batrachochytrium salamandrivorans]KAH6574708.1 hypothetical protein BASA62_002336 [Batrachochytrium salamandrivorans]KAH6594754.1 hypothetical protein BASA50_006429 [Batrachochytrium salamandrivorans]KAH6596803.1 hypothetical protein BASA61_003337 [Batrachochytrium salamandrivorans]KAH9267464.1 hypothetical protein BASA84_000640 [Batrachochytrium salamandrivorans]
MKSLYTLRDGFFGRWRLGLDIRLRSTCYIRPSPAVMALVLCRNHTSPISTLHLTPVQKALSKPHSTTTAYPEHGSKSINPKVLTEYLDGRQRHYYLQPTYHSLVGPHHRKPVFKWADHKEGANVSTDKKNVYSMNTDHSYPPSFWTLASSYDRLVGWLRDMFLPIGYPSSVHCCYKKIHLWLFVENVAGAAISVLTAQAMLTSIGASAAAHETAALAIAVDWVLKDGIGELGKMLLVQRFAHQFDTHPKLWKLYGEGCSVVGALVQIATCIVSPHYFLLLASIGVGLRAIHYSVWAATHISFTRNMATQNGVNVGDIVAKADSQLSLAHLLGMMCGIGMLAVSFQPLALFSWFGIMAMVQVACTCFLLRSAQFEVLDQARLVLLPREFIYAGKGKHVLGLPQISVYENWLNEGLGPGEVVAELSIGDSVSEAFKESRLDYALELFQNEHYLLGIELPNAIHHHSKLKLHAVMHKDMAYVDIIQAALHAVRMDFEFTLRQSASCAPLSLSEAEELLKSSLEWTRKHMPVFMDGLDKQGWKTDLVIWRDRGIRVEWDATRN